jgi:magnesium chelatase family protein
MSLSIVYSRANAGMNAPLVTVEAHLSNGLPSFSIVGLPETAVKESKDRVRSAIINSQFEFPLQRITINLAPADLPKEGGRFDLPIAIGILAASGQLPDSALPFLEFAGELALSGELRPTHGILPFALATRRAQRSLVIAQANAVEAAFSGDVTVLAANALREVAAHLLSQHTIVPYVAAPIDPTGLPNMPDLADVHGQLVPRRALEVAAAGGHSLLMVGPPGTGKTMLASRLPGILPALTLDEALEVAAITSLSKAGIIQQSWRIRPFRAPHHTASAAALVGGGSMPMPGEISLAHQGVLFLDELPEFNRHVLEVLREPLESGRITISRAARQAEFPARFQLMAAMNPCPCGYSGDARGRCRCSEEKIERYKQKLSGPLLDRIDMHVEVPALPYDVLNAASSRTAETSATVRARVTTARDRQWQRQQKINAYLSNTEMAQFCPLSNAALEFMKTAMEQLAFSARVYHRIIRVARTLSDLSDAAEISIEHLSEAIHYRRLERRTTMIK